MRRIKRTLAANPPEGWEAIKKTMLYLNRKKREADAMCEDENMTREQVAAIEKANWNRCRFVFIKRFVDKVISNELYEWLLHNGFADKPLIEQWRKPGYERLCCLACMSKKNAREGCDCRKPKSERGTAPCKCRECWCTGCCTEGSWEEPNFENDLTDDEDSMTALSGTSE